MRRHTPLYRLKTLPASIAQVLHAVTEGLSPRAAARVFELPEATVRTWLTRAGLHSHALHDQLFRGLHLAHVQLDELRLKLRGAAAAAWLWVACDARTKLILAFALGPRTQTLTNQLAQELVRRLAPGELPFFSSDGLGLSFYSLTAHFGHWLPATRERLRHWIVEERLLYAQVGKHCTCPNGGAGAGRHHRLARGTARLPRPAGSLPSLSVRSRPLGPDPDGVH